MAATLSARTREVEEIAKRLDLLRELPETDPKRVETEREFLELLERNLREVLKPLLLARFGSRVDESGNARFTSMLNDFFVKVATLRPDEFWRARTVADLQKWTRRVISNAMIDLIRRERKYVGHDDGFGDLIQARVEHFRDKIRREWSLKALDLIDAWCDQGLLKGFVLRHKFIEGMTRVESAADLKVSVHAVRTALEAAMGELRSALPLDE